MPLFLPFYYLCNINPEKIMELFRYYYYTDFAFTTTMDRYFYHPDHTSTRLSTGLGSSSWITDNTGRPIQHLHYLPFGEDWVDQRNSNWNTPYTFSGKEKDVETGYGYFSARYYDSGLSIWLSVDPMSDKYPSMSPYNYCANNPVILVDPDGRDYETVIDEKKGTITIKAVYYTSKSNEKRLQNALDAWNDQSGKYEVVVGEGDNKKKYTVNYELTMESDFETNTDAQTAMPNERGNANYFGINDEMESKDKGYSVGYNAMVRTGGSYRTDVHEIGHTLGIDDGIGGVMEQGSSSSKIQKVHVMQSLRNAGAKVYGTTWGQCAPNNGAKTNQIDLNGKFKRKSIF